MTGKVVHHDKYGYGVTWRVDKFSRISVKFESGKEVGGLSQADVRFVDKEEFDEKDVLSRLKMTGLDSHIAMTADEVASQARVEDISRTKTTFQRLYNETMDLVREGKKTEDVVKRNMDLLEASPLDNFSKGKISKRLSRMEDTEHLLKYVRNSLGKYRKMDEDSSFLRLNIMLNEVIKDLRAEIKSGEDETEEASM